MAAIVAVWYVAFVAFRYYPYCSPGSDPSGATCYWGDVDYGVLYHQVFYFSISFGLLIAIAVFCAWGLMEWRHHQERRHAV